MAPRKSKRSEAPRGSKLDSKRGAVRHRQTNRSTVPTRKVTSVASTSSKGVKETTPPKKCPVGRPPGRRKATGAALAKLLLHGGDPDDPDDPSAPKAKGSDGDQLLPRLRKPRPLASLQKDDRSRSAAQNPTKGSTVTKRLSPCKAPSLSEPSAANNTSTGAAASISPAAKAPSSTDAPLYKPWDSAALVREPAIHREGTSYHCSVKDCPFRNLDSSRGLWMFALPMEQEVAEVWRKSVSIIEKSNRPLSPRVCFRHFNKSDFVRRNNRLIGLESSAVPSRVNATAYSAPEVSGIIHPVRHLLSPEVPSKESSLTSRSTTPKERNSVNAASAVSEPSAESSKKTRHCKRESRSGASVQLKEDSPVPGPSRKLRPTNGARRSPRKTEQSLAKPGIDNGVLTRTSISNASQQCGSTNKGKAVVMNSTLGDSGEVLPKVTCYVATHQPLVAASQQTSPGNIAATASEKQQVDVKVVPSRPSSAALKGDSVDLVTVASEKPWPDVSVIPPQPASAPPKLDSFGAEPVVPEDGHAIHGVAPTESPCHLVPVPQQTNSANPATIASEKQHGEVSLPRPSSPALKGDSVDVVIVASEKLQLNFSAIPLRPASTALRRDSFSAEPVVPKDGHASDGVAVAEYLPCVSESAAAESCLPNNGDIVKERKPCHPLSTWLESLNYDDEKKGVSEPVLGSLENRDCDKEENGLSEPVLDPSENLDCDNDDPVPGPSSENLGRDDKEKGLSKPVLNPSEDSNSHVKGKGGLSKPVLCLSENPDSDNEEESLPGLILSRSLPSVDEHEGFQRFLHSNPSHKLELPKEEMSCPLARLSLFPVDAVDICELQEVVVTEDTYSDAHSPLAMAENDPSNSNGSPSESAPSPPEKSDDSSGKQCPLESHRSSSSANESSVDGINQSSFPASRDAPQLSKENEVCDAVLHYKAVATVKKECPKNARQSDGSSSEGARNFSTVGSMLSGSQEMPDKDNTSATVTKECFENAHQSNGSSSERAGNFSTVGCMLSGPQKMPDEDNTSAVAPDDDTRSFPELESLSGSPKALDELERTSLPVAPDDNAVVAPAPSPMAPGPKLPLDIAGERDAMAGYLDSQLASSSVSGAERSRRGRYVVVETPVEDSDDDGCGAYMCTVVWEGSGDPDLSDEDNEERSDCDLPALTLREVKEDLPWLLGDSGWEIEVQPDQLIVSEPSSSHVDRCRRVIVGGDLMVSSFLADRLVLGPRLISKVDDLIVFFEVLIGGEAGLIP